MNLEALKSIANYLGYSTSDTPTSNADMQTYMTNQNNVLMAIVASSGLWQPATSYSIGSTVHSPNQLPGTIAVVTTSGMSGQEEPKWTALNTTISDGGVTYVIIAAAYRIASESEIIDGTDDAKIVTPAKITKWFTSKVASDEQAKTGSNDTTIMTPLKTTNVIKRINPIVNIDAVDAKITFGFADGTTDNFTIDNVASATKATKDSSDNIISETYLPKTTFNALGLSIVDGMLCVTYKE